MAADYEKLAGQISQVFKARGEDALKGEFRFLAEILAGGKSLRQFIDEDLDRSEMVKKLTGLVSGENTPSGEWMVARARLHFVSALHRELHVMHGNRLANRRRFAAEQPVRQAMIEAEMDTFTKVLESIG